MARFPHFTALALALALTASSAAQAQGPCGVGSVVRAIGDLFTAVEAAPEAVEVAPEPVVRDAVSAPFLEPLLRQDRGAVSRLADRSPGSWRLATPGELAQAITMMQRGSTGDQQERGILNLLGALEPAARAKALRLIDQGRDKYDLDKLVYDDVDDAGRRARLLALVEEAGRALT